MKKIVLLIAAITMLIMSASFAADNTTDINGADNDDINTVEVLKTNDANYYRYENSRFQYAVDIPVTATEAISSTNGDGCKFIDPADGATYTVYGAENTMHFTLQNLYNVDMGIINFPKLTNKSMGKNYYAIAWEKDNMGYYKKVVLNKDTYASFGIAYPLSKKEKYKAIIAHMDKSFVPSNAQAAAK